MNNITHKKKMDRQFFFFTHSQTYKRNTMVKSFWNGKRNTLSHCHHWTPRDKRSGLQKCMEVKANNGYCISLCHLRYLTQFARHCQLPRSISWHPCLLSTSFQYLVGNGTEMIDQVDYKVFLITLFSDKETEWRLPVNHNGKLTFL